MNETMEMNQSAEGKQNVPFKCTPTSDNISKSVEVKKYTEKCNYTNKKSDFEKYESIEEQVDVLLRQYGYSPETDTSLDIVDFVKKFGFKVGTADLEEEKDGFLFIEPNMLDEKGGRVSGNKIIVVNNDRSYAWKRFIIAHEFAHSVLDYDKKNLYERNHIKGKDDEENGADYLAAALLMPRESFRRKYNVLKNKGLRGNFLGFQLASIYRVPEESAFRRIDEVIEEK